LFSTSREQRVGQLLSHDEMGDREVWNLAPDVPDDFFEQSEAAHSHRSVSLYFRPDRGKSRLSLPHRGKICKVTPLPITANISSSAPDITAGLL